MQDKELLQGIDAFIEENREGIVRDLASLIAVKSVEGEPAPGAPFGPGPRAALDEALRIAAALGFETHDGDGYVGWAELRGEREEYYATITHVDVVPEAEGWDSDPYTLTERDGWLIARGVGDDKGPGILCLYAAKYIKEKYGTPPYSLRVLFGTNEESGMADVPYYLEHNPQPLFCFSPDTDFPVCNGEKGHYGARFVSPKLDGSIVDIQGGYAPNVIPDRAFCLLKNSAARLPDTEWVKVSEAEGLVRLDASGIGGHAAHPEGTVNAIGQLVDYLLAQGLCTEAENRYLALLQRLHKASDGSGLGIAATDPVFDPLTIIGGMITMQDGVIEQDMDSRFPPATSVNSINDVLEPLVAEHGAALRVGRCAEPFYLPADIPAVKALTDSYTEVTGKSAGTYTMGGGTYARKFEAAVSFGPHDPETEKPGFVGGAHAANEGDNFESMLKALKIYILSFERLQQIPY